MIQDFNSCSTKNISHFDDLTIFSYNLEVKIAHDHRSFPRLHTLQNKYENSHLPISPIQLIELLFMVKAYTLLFSESNKFNACKVQSRIQKFKKNFSPYLVFVTFHVFLFSSMFFKTAYLRNGFNEILPFVREYDTSSVLVDPITLTSVILVHDKLVINSVKEVHKL